MADDTKTIRELVFFYPDHRARGEYGAYGEGFTIEPEKGETFQILDSGMYQIVKASGEVVTIASGWLYFTDRTRDIKKYVPNAEKSSIVRSSD